MLQITLETARKARPGCVIEIVEPEPKARDRYGIDDRHDHDEYFAFKHA